MNFQNFKNKNAFFDENSKILTQISENQMEE